MQPGGRSETNLKLLRAFAAVGRHLSFSRAAAELNRSQATLSVQVRELERQLNVGLLERTTRRVALTDAGARLADAIEAGLAVIESGLAAAKEAGDVRKNRIMMACVPSISATCLPSLLASFRAKERRVRIDVAELTSNEIFVALVERRVDFGLGPAPDPPPPDITFTPVVDDPLYALLPLGKQGANRTGIPFDRLAKMSLITLSGSVLLQQMLDQAAAERGITLNTHAEVRHVQTAIAMARAGVGAAIVPYLALPDHVDEDVLLVPIIEPSLTRKVGLITRAGTPLEQAAARLAHHIRSALPRRSPPELAPVR